MPDIAAILQDLSESPGISACVLSDVDSGMAIHHCGELPELERIGEAAVEFWRVQTRLGSYFETLGPVSTVAYFFRDYLIALFPCQQQPPLVLICVAHKSSIDWQACRLGVSRLKKALALRPH